MSKSTRLTLATALGTVLAGPIAAQDLTIWGLPAFNEAGDAAMLALAEQFGAENGLEVEYLVVPADVLSERLAAAFEGGAPPDLFMQVGQQAQFYMSRGLVRPLGGVLETMRAVEGGIFENTVAQGMLDGVVHAVPLEVDIVPMFARTDLLEAVGMGVPQTWEELREASQKMLALDPTLTAFGMPTSASNDAESMMRALVWSFGGAMFDATGQTITWNSPETVAAYQFVADMFAEGTIPRSTLSWDDGGNNTAYQTGRTAFTMNPPSIYQWLTENDQELLANTALIPVPRGPGDKGRSAGIISAFVWMVAAESDNPDGAEAFLEYFFEPERYSSVITAIGGRWVPIYPALVDTLPLFTETPAFANVKELAANGLVDGHAGPPSLLASEAFAAKIVTTSLQRMLVDGESAADAVAWAQSEIEALAAAQ